VVYDKYYSSFGTKIGGSYTPVLEPLEDLHFFSTLEGDVMPVGNINYVYAIMAVGILIVLLACINYMNLATAKSMSRAREIGMKKTLGSTKASLSARIIGESIFTAMLALVVALVIVNLVITSPSFSQITDRKLILFSNDSFFIFIVATGLTLLIGVLSGIYPALYLSRIPILTAINGTFRNSHSSIVFRKLLIGTQLAISTFVITCTFFIQDQISFVRNKSLGFNKENVLILPVQDTIVTRQMNAIQNELSKLPGVIATTTAENVIGLDVSAGNPLKVENGDGMKDQMFNIIYVGDNYLETLGIGLVEGRDFKEANADKGFLINETGVRQLGWQGNAIGKKITSFDGRNGGEIIGVVKDFNYQSLRRGIEPLLIVKVPKPNGYLHIRIAPGDQHATIGSLLRQWKSYNDGTMTDFFFLDSKFNEVYKSDEVQAKLLSILSTLSIFVSLLGLIGLSTFNAAQRIKEIGIRKILGANRTNIAMLLSKDLLITVSVASIVTIPLSFFAVSDWMSQFEHKVGVDFVAIVMIILSTIAAVFTVITIQSLKSMATNPATVLRNN
jgi:putative ABC transport system permease protein